MVQGIALSVRIEWIDTARFAGAAARGDATPHIRTLRSPITDALVAADLSNFAADGADERREFAAEARLGAPHATGGTAVSHPAAMFAFTPAGNTRLRVQVAGEPFIRATETVVAARFVESAARHAGEAVAADQVCAIAAAVGATLLAVAAAPLACVTGAGEADELGIITDIAPAAALAGAAARGADPRAAPSSDTEEPFIARDAARATIDPAAGLVVATAETA